MSGTVRHNPDESRYELELDGALALTAYRLVEDVATFYHTEVPAALERRGIGSRLVGAALADVRERGWRVRPTCPFVAHYLDTHPEFADLRA